MEWQEVEAALKHLAPPFPRAAVEETRQRWDEWAPHFIAAIRHVADGGGPSSDETEEELDGLFCFATWLAAEKRDTRAYAPLVRASHCTEERAEALFGDDLADGLGRMLASVCDGDIGPLRMLAEDRDAAMWCRFAGIHAQFIRVVENDGDQDELLDWLMDFCERETEVVRHQEWDFEHEPDDLLSWAVDFVGILGPSVPMLEKIRGWFDEELIDPSVRGLSFFERQAARSATDCLAEAGADSNNRYVRDVVHEMEWWACFNEGGSKDLGNFDDFDAEDSIDPAWLDRLMPSAGGPHLIHTEGTFRRETPKPGRNDACPCGSGKKYKKCCGREGATSDAAPDPAASAVRLCIEWLTRHHEEAMRESLRDMLLEMIEEENADALDALNADFWKMAQINALEWLLAEGWIWVRGKHTAVSSLLLGPKGPPLSTSQRRWLERLSSRPLRLYEVTATVPGARMTLCDALDLAAPPVVVTEKSGSRTAHAGMKLAARIVPVGDHHELSGAVYPFTALHVPALIKELQEDVSELAADHPDDLPKAISETIRRHWLHQHLHPAPLPTLVDSHSGNILLFVTDRYRVRDWTALERAFAASPDIDGDRASGWKCNMECADGLIRARASFEPASEPDTLEVFYRTQQYADDGRPWFEALAGDAVEFVGREIKDPKVSMMLGTASGGSDGSGARSTARSSPEIPPGALADIIEQTLRRSYANWADEPIQALGNRTPRQAIETPGGRERVKGLLRSYEESEKREASKQGRRAISYDFLWESLGLGRG